MGQFPRSKAWRIGIIGVPIVLLVGLYLWTKPRKVVDASLIGKWADSEGKSVEFLKDETFVLRTTNNEYAPLPWWSDETHVLHILHPDEDAPRLVLVPYHFEGNNKLRLDNAQFWDLPANSTRVIR